MYIAWSLKNRSPLIRIPAQASTEQGRVTQRVELRSPDSAANPYLALAVCLAAGLDGIRNHIEPPASVDGNIFEMSDEERRSQKIECLPENLMEAIEALEKDSLICGVLGSHICKRYIEAKKEEWKDYCAAVSNWEIDRYLVNI